MTDSERKIVMDMVSTLEHTLEYFVENRKAELIGADGEEFFYTKDAKEALSNLWDVLNKKKKPVPAEC